MGVEIITSAINELWDNRVDFVKYVIGETPTDQQGDALRALDRHDAVSITSGHGCGKSSVQSWDVLHYMNCRPFPKVPCTAPTKHQLYDVLWAELSKWHRKMQPAFREQFQWTKEKFFHKAHPEEWFAVARTATKENPEALQGFHADYVSIVVDEASGVLDSSYEVLEGAHGKIETKMLLCGNPTRREGAFFDSHHRLKDLYHRLQWSCLDSPLVPERFIKRIEKRFGLESNIYRVRVLGLFPLHSEDTFIPYSWVEEALVREIPPQDEHPLVFGLDVARYGDDYTVLARRQGDEFKEYDVLKNKNTMEVTGFVARAANKEKPRHIFVDVIGLGAGVYDRLYELGFPVIPVNVAESPAINGREYRRLRDELWGHMRDWLEMKRGRLWDNEDGDLLGELTGPFIDYLSDGRIVVESKDQMKKRRLMSPNIADACIMTFAQPYAAYKQEDDDFYEEYSAYADRAYAPLDSWAGY